MQAVLVVHKNDRSSAEALEPQELIKNINLCAGPNELYEHYGDWLCQYALICQNVLKLKGYKPVIDQRVFMEQLRGIDIRPRWHDRFIPQHRSFLAMLGWVRYFNERGATGSVLGPEGRLSVLSTIKEASGPVELLASLNELDNWCDYQGMPTATRSYASFTETPAAFELHP